MLSCFSDMDILYLLVHRCGHRQRTCRPSIVPLEAILSLTTTLTLILPSRPDPLSTLISSYSLYPILFSTNQIDGSNENPEFEGFDWFEPIKSTDRPHVHLQFARKIRGKKKNSEELNLLPTQGEAGERHSQPASLITYVGMSYSVPKKSSSKLFLTFSTHKIVISLPFLQFKTT